MTDLSPDLLVTKARIKMMKKSPFFATLAMNLVPRATHDLSTFATDTVSLFYNPDYVVELERKDFELIISAVAHEVGHVYLMHNLRRGERDAQVYNLAGDFVINDLLVDSGFGLDNPATWEESKAGKIGWLHDPKFNGMTTEHVYKLLMEDMPKDKNGKPNIGHGLGGKTGCCKPAPGDSDGNVTKETLDAHERRIKQAITQAAQVAKMQGNLPASLAHELDDILNPPERWQDILREFITHISRDDYSWSRPNRAHINRGIIIPSCHSHNMGDIVVALDSSGSCLNEFGLFMDNLNSIIEDCKPSLVHVIHCDAAVERVDEFNRDDLPIPKELHGGGGTDFRPVFNYVEQRHIDPECLIYFTDTYGNFPANEPDYPVLWAVTENEESIPWGRTLTVGAE